jgi:hypothetical protein
MFAEQFTAAITTASLNSLDHLSKAIWQSHGAGAITDDDAQRLAETIEARRTVARAAHKPAGLAPGRLSIFPPRRYQRSPDKARSLERRRMLAFSGPLPPTLACRFTVGELAVLRIVSDAVRDGGQCCKTIPEIAARAGVSRRLAQNAIREAARQGLITVQERRREGRRNDANVVQIISAEWRAWIKRGSGCNSKRPTDTRLAFQESRAKSVVPSRHQKRREFRERYAT